METLLDEVSNTLHFIHNTLTKNKIDPAVLKQLEEEIEKVGKEFNQIRCVMQNYVQELLTVLRNSAAAFKDTITAQLRAAFAPGGTINEAGNKSVSRIQRFLQKIRVVKKVRYSNNFFRC